MLRGNWLKFAATVGLALCLIGEASAQPIDQDGSAQPSSEDAAADHLEISIEPSRFMPIQDAMERIASSLEAINNHERTADETNQVRRDLEAQENMAFWAFWMFWASAAGTLLTAVGLLLIWRTVVYTRSAAESANAAVDEAKNATAAAEAAVIETRRVGQAQVRAYLHCTGGEFIFGDDFLAIEVHVSNTGQSPAPICKAEGTILALRPPEAPPHPLGMDLLRKPLHPGEFVSVSVGGGRSKAHLKAFDLPKKDLIVQAVGKGDWNFYVNASLVWQDVFGDEQTTHIFLVPVGRQTHEETPGGYRRTGKLESLNTKPTNEREWP